jgi:hypothetical protein
MRVVSDFISKFFILLSLINLPFSKYNVSYFFSSLLISYAIDCAIITTFIDYGFPNFNLDQF